MLPRAAHAFVVVVGAAVASFGFLSLVLVGLAAGGSVAGLPGALVLAAALGVGWLFCVRWGWRRISNPVGPSG